MSFTGIFRQHARGTHADLVEAKGLESILGELFAAACAAWPGFSVAPEDFLRHLAEKLPVEVNTAGTLRATFAADLYLALACCRGDAAALSAFETHFLGTVASYFVRREEDREFANELKQRLRTRLFIGENGAQPKIGSYSGQGPLAVWLRTTASRVALNMRRDERRHSLRSDEELQIESPNFDPEMDYMKTLYRGELEKAFRTTLATLSLNESNILRMHFLKGMTTSAICGVYRVSVRTVRRRIAEARHRILEETQRLLAAQLDLSASQVNTVMRLAQSQIQISLQEFFRDPASVPKTGK